MRSCGFQNLKSLLEYFHFLFGIFEHISNNLFGSLSGILSKSLSLEAVFTGVIFQRHMLSWFLRIFCFCIEAFIAGVRLMVVGVIYLFKSSFNGGIAMFRGNGL